jgi:hypothetical protein
LRLSDAERLDVTEIVFAEPTTTAWCLMSVLIAGSQYFPEWSSVLQPLSPLFRLFLLLLLFVCIYTTYFASFALLRLRSLRTVRTDNSAQNDLAQLDYRSANLRQIIAATSYLFGLSFFLQIQNAYWTLENNRPVGPMILGNFREDFRLAAAIFLAFLVLHSVQWFVSSRIRRATIRLVI